MSEVIICGSCCHEHDSPNGPSGCCEHGPYLYFCPDCQEKGGVTDERP